MTADAGDFDVFPVRVIPADAGDLTEPLGTKRKFWLRDADGGWLLFKEGREGTGENWSEKAASELCALLGLPHATVDLAVWGERRGIASPTFMPPDGQLEMGNELLSKLVSDYQETATYKQKLHSVKLVIKALSMWRVLPPVDVPDPVRLRSAADVFVGYLMFDAWIGNTDRHHENWAVIRTPGAPIRLAPTYDHASSLGRIESDGKRHDILTTRDANRSLVKYVERARSAFYARPEDRKTMTTLAAFREAARLRPDAAAYWVLALANTNDDDIRRIFDRLPADFASPAARRFAIAMLHMNRQRICAAEVS